MKVLLALIVSICVSMVHGQRCSGKLDESIVGDCAEIGDCRGSIFAAETCEFGRCCIKEGSPLLAPTCINVANFESFYNTSRAKYLRTVLNYGINQAGICSNCQAQAAFLAIASTLTDDFQEDEARGSDASFTADDNKYGNNQTGDGSRFRRRGFFGLRGRTMYSRFQKKMPQYQVLDSPEWAAVAENAILVASQMWKTPDLLNGPALTNEVDGTFFGFSLLWYRLNGNADQLGAGTIRYAEFLRQLQCGGDLYPGQGGGCSYNATHNGICVADCIRGMEEAGEYCGCSGAPGPQCPNSPPHIRCCLDTCSQELKMDLGFVLDASGSIGSSNYKLQQKFVNDLLGRVNVGRNKTHVGIINYSSRSETLTYLNTDHALAQKRDKVNKATYYGQSTNTGLALREASDVFSDKNGLRGPQEGATQVIFVITDGASQDENATLDAADVLKKNGIHLVSVGVGNSLNLNELYRMCTPPSSENYFAISNYAALEQKINQFTSKSCSEPAVIPANVTVVTEVGKEKYKFLKVKIIINGNKIMIKVKLFNGKIKLFYSFKSRNPKDPNDFNVYQPSASTSFRSLSEVKVDDATQHLQKSKSSSNVVTLVTDKPGDDVEFVYVGIKGVEEDNKFEVNFDDCEKVDCRSAASTLAVKFSFILVLLSMLLAMKNIA